MKHQTTLIEIILQQTVMELFRVDNRDYFVANLISSALNLAVSSRNKL